MMMRIFSQLTTLPVARDMAVEAELVARNAALGAPGYNANPNGYFTVGRNATADQYPGQLVKIQVERWAWTPLGNPGDYFVLEMTRNETERQTSVVRGFGNNDSAQISAFQQGETNLHARSDCSVITVDFLEMLNHPLIHLVALKTAGWPLARPADGPGLVDWTLYRNQLV